MGPWDDFSSFTPILYINWDLFRSATIPFSCPFSECKTWKQNRLSSYSSFHKRCNKTFSSSLAFIHIMYRDCCHFPENMTCQDPNWDGSWHINYICSSIQVRMTNTRDARCKHHHNNLNISCLQKWINSSICSNGQQFFGKLRIDMATKLASCHT